MCDCGERCSAARAAKIAAEPLAAKGSELQHFGAVESVDGEQ